MYSNQIIPIKRSILLFNLIIAAAFIYGCGASTAHPEMYQQQVQSLPVITLNSVSANTYREYSASIEGTKDIEIRPQVEGYLDKIYVDEGAHVKKGQPLFQINDRPYREQLNNAKAALTAAQANLANAEINVTKLTPLVENNVISDVQLKTAKASHDAAKANVAQAQSMVENAAINLGYTIIKAPVNGYIGRIPHKTGSLVGINTAQALTVISEINEIKAYFSLSEGDYLEFKNQFEGKSIEEKLKLMPPVELVLADNSIYQQKGKVETVAGQFNNSMGAISFRASFPNSDGMLRSGNTGRIRIPRPLSTAVVVPQESTFELQDKVFVFTLTDSNKVVSAPISIVGKSGNYYLVDKGVTAGLKIVYSGLDRLRDGTLIKPEAMSLDSLLKARPL